MEAIQYRLRLVADAAQTGGLVLLIPQRIAQGRIGHGGNNGICVRVAVSGDVNGIHERNPPSDCRLMF